MTSLTPAASPVETIRAALDLVHRYIITFGTERYETTADEVLRAVKTAYAASAAITVLSTPPELESTEEERAKLDAFAASNGRGNCDLQWSRVRAFLRDIDTLLACFNQEEPMPERSLEEIDEIIGDAIGKAHNAPPVSTVGRAISAQELRAWFAARPGASWTATLADIDEALEAMAGESVAIAEAHGGFIAEDYRSVLSSIDRGVFVHTDAKCISAALRLAAALVSSEADRLALTRSLDRERELEAEVVQLKRALRIEFFRKGDA